MLGTSLVLETARQDAYAEPGYRALNPLAVAALVGGVLSPMAFLSWALALIPLCTVLVAVRALWRIRQAPEEFTGTRLAQLGLTLALVCWGLGWARLGYVYATEVPEGYQRVGYELLQPAAGQMAMSVPASALALDGKKIFIKGFVYPTSQASNIERFVLCRDNGDCCFGGSPKLTDMIDVRLVDPLRLNYSRRLHTVAGVFHVSPVGDPQARGAVYRLDADVLR